MEIDLIEKSLESTKNELLDKFKSQREHIEKTGEVCQRLEKQSKETEIEYQKLKNRMLDIEQKQVQAPELMRSKAWEEKLCEKLKSAWNGHNTKAEFDCFRTKMVSSDNASAGVLVRPERLPGIINPGKQKLFIRQLLSPGTTQGSSIEFCRQNVFTNKADMVAEGMEKPQSDISYEVCTTNVRLIAHWIPVTMQILDDAPLLQSLISTEMLYGLALKEEEQILNGDGTGQNLLGLNRQATEYDIKLNNIKDTYIDVLAHAMFQVRKSKFPATGFILNPADWHQIALTKKTDESYLLAGPSTYASNILWGLPVIESDTQAIGTFTVGSFFAAAQIFDRMGATMAISDSDRDNFIKNMYTLRCEERLALAITRPQAIVKGTFPKTPDGLKSEIMNKANSENSAKK